MMTPTEETIVKRKVITTTARSKHREVAQKMRNGLRSLGSLSHMARRTDTVRAKLESQGTV